MNLVCLMLGRCPVAALGPYGNEWVATPHLDALAGAGVVFDRHTSECPDETAARDALVGAGFLAHLRTYGVTAVLLDATRAGVRPEFAGRFDVVIVPTRAAGDETATAGVVRALGEIARVVRGKPYFLWVELDRLVAPWDVPQDVFEAYIEDVFDTAQDDPASRESTLDMEEVLTAGEEIVIDPTAEEYTEDYTEADEPAGREMVVREVVRPWADPPAGWFDRNDLPSWELLHRSFAATVTTLDATLGKLFEALTSLGFDDAAWAVTSDRGQALGEHGIVGDFRPWLYQELVHLPLVVRLPGGAGAGRRVGGLTTPADLVPTALELLGLPAPPNLSGVSLVPQLSTRETTDRTHVVTRLSWPDSSESAVRTLAHAYIHPERVPEDDDPRGPELYVKPEDRFEMNDVAALDATAVERLSARLHDG